MIRVCIFGCIPKLMKYNPTPHLCRTPSQYRKWWKRIGKTYGMPSPDRVGE